MVKPFQPCSSTVLDRARLQAPHTPAHRQHLDTDLLYQLEPWSPRHSGCQFLHTKELCRRSPSTDFSQAPAHLPRGEKTETTGGWAPCWNHTMKIWSVAAPQGPPSSSALVQTQESYKTASHSSYPTWALLSGAQNNHNLPSPLCAPSTVLHHRI